MSVPDSTQAEASIAERPILWTGWLRYFATGEGETLMACIAYARTADEMKARFAKTFDSYFAIGCTVAAGVVRNDVTQTLWSDRALELIELAGQRRGAVYAHSWLHRNLA
jgi:hypothetical protein